MRLLLTIWTISIIVITIIQFLKIIYLKIPHNIMAKRNLILSINEITLKFKSINKILKLNVFKIHNLIQFEKRTHIINIINTGNV